MDKDSRNFFARYKGWLLLFLGLVLISVLCDWIAPVRLLKMH